MQKCNFGSKILYAKVLLLLWVTVSAFGLPLQRLARYPNNYDQMQKTSYVKADILVRVDVVSLFIKVLVTKIIKYHPEKLKVVKNWFSNTYFVYDN